MMHFPWFYKRFHKIHHEYTVPVAFVATYAHPVEHLLVNIFPAFCLLPFINNYWFSNVWLSIVVVNTCFTHSGYNVWLVDASQHDYHHEAFNWNFAFGIGMLDRYFGSFRPVRPTGTGLKQA